MSRVLELRTASPTVGLLCSGLLSADISNDHMFVVFALNPLILDLIMRFWFIGIEPFLVIGISER